MTIEVDLEGRRYIEDRDTTAVLAGSQSRATSFTEHWTLALDGDAAAAVADRGRRRAARPGVSRRRRPASANAGGADV